MKKYYIEYYRDFRNTYNLYWAESDEQIKLAESKGFERITRKAAEMYARTADDYGSSVIVPVDYEGAWQYDKSVYVDGRIVEYM